MCDANICVDIMFDANICVDIMCDANICVDITTCVTCVMQTSV